MKRIHFDSSKNLFWLVVLICSLLLIIFSFIKPIQFKNPNIYKYLEGIAYFSNALYFSKIFWYKNYVWWNSKGIFIRVQSVNAHTIRFVNMKQVDLKEQLLIITKNNDDKIVFNISQVLKTDAKKLYEVLLKNMNLKKA